MFERGQCSFLLLGRPGHHELNVRMAIIRRKMHFYDGGRAYPRVRHLVADQLFEFLANDFRDALIAMGVQPSG